jgi:8-oxo-dGTP diphosphatase
MCAVGAIILERSELVLVKRAREPALGEWSLPGGRVEIGESLAEACAREVREECGLDVEVEGLAGVFERILRDDDGRVTHHYVIHDFWVKPRGHDLTPGDDADDARWVAVDQLSEYTLTAGLFEFLQDRGALEGRRPRV